MKASASPLTRSTSCWRTARSLLLDVREPKELEELGTIEDSINIPLGQLEKRLGELPKDRLILTA